jgi:hypothetical protein
LKKNENYRKSRRKVNCIDSIVVLYQSTVTNAYIGSRT